MIYLLLAILSSTLIPIIFKLAHKKKVNEPVVITMNYLTISVVMTIMTIKNGLLFHFFEGIKPNLDNTYFVIAIIGIVSGYFFYISFYYYQKSVRQCGPTLSGAFGKMGILIPAILSLILWKEYPTIAQWVGIVVAVLAIGIMVFDFKTFKMNQLHKVLIVFMLLGGLGDFSTKVFQVYSNVELKELYLLITFLFAMIFSLYVTVKISKVQFWDLALGILIGIPNVLASYFLIMALNQMIAVIVFPLFSGGTVVLVSVLSYLLFKERLQRKHYYGIVLIVISLLFINIS